MAESYIKTLKDERENIIYPQTLASAVVTTGGSDAQTVLDGCVKAVDLTSMPELTPTVTTGVIANGAVTYEKIDSDISIAEKIYSYTQATDATDNTVVKNVVIDWTKYNRVVVDVAESVGSGYSGSWQEIKAYQDSGASSFCTTYQWGYQMGFGSTGLTGIAREVAGSVIGINVNAGQQGFYWIDMVHNGDSTVGYVGFSNGGTQQQNFNGRINPAPACLRIQLDKPKAGSHIRVIGYRK